MLNLQQMRYGLIFLLVFFPIFSSQAKSFTGISGDLLSEAKAYREEGYKLQSMGDFAGALPFYQKAAQLDPNSAEIYNDIGIIYENLGQPEKALGMYKKTLAIDKNYLSAYTNLAFFYENLGDLDNAGFYWQKRYELGQEGEYWWEVSRQHLLKLGTYPKVRQEMLERAAMSFSQDLVYKREQARLKAWEEAKLHVQVAAGLMAQNDYSQALKELDTALSLNVNDKQFILEAEDLRQRACKAYIKQQTSVEIESALNSLQKDDFNSAREKLKRALSATSTIAQENK
jgi:tetratricopeptide (TPR) repeat protein